MADARHLLVLNLMAPALAKFPPYTGQEPPNDYLNKVIQLWAYLEGHMIVLENANAGDFDNAVKYNILKSIMGGKYIPVLANNNLVLYDTSDTYEARIRPLLLEVANNDTQLEHEQNFSERIPEELSQIANQVQILSSINLVSYSLPLVTPAPQQQGHTISLENMQKAIQNTLAQQKTEY
ncbi:3928_t:CDS:2 [Cetraspora pellucida]|uniref:3928_t:CDS:1 n=1 Tax=Cetraspora pellucida TaxID=1433469 RepID=A0A9N9BYV1_9GLOM|nr:3928_t:CDS:2 [Cetraspora pellucida]